MGECADPSSRATEGHRASAPDADGLPFRVGEVHRLREGSMSGSEGVNILMVEFTD